MSRVEEFYARFESRFRGTRQQILERLQTYGPLIGLLEARTDNRVAVDCGCGRGEWLELVGERGWSARGVDMSEAMLAEANDRGLNTVHADAIDYLKTWADGSVGLLSAFHLVEHLAAEVLLTFLTECARVCAVDGVVIFETPNPENLRVGTATFHLDPTHDKPLPPQLLQFYVEECGFAHAHVIRLNGTPEPEVITSLVGAMRPLFEGGLDYAVIATKSDDHAFRQAIEAYVKRTTQPIPTSLDGARAYDLAHQATFALQVADAQSATQARGETQQGLHSAIEAVHNAVSPLADQLHESVLRQEVATEADRRTASEQSVLVRRLAEEFTRAQATSQETQQALHSAVVAVHNAVEPLAGRVGALEESLERAFDAERERAENERLHAMQQVVDQWPEVQRTMIGMHGAVHSAVVAVHDAIGLLAGQVNEVGHFVAVSVERDQQGRKETVAAMQQRAGEQRALIDALSSGLEARFEAQRMLLERLESQNAAAVDAILKRVLLAHRTQAECLVLEQATALSRVERALDRLAEHQRDIAATEEAVRREMSDAAERHINALKDQFHQSRSWRVTAPLRALSTFMHPKPVEAGAQATLAPVPRIPAARRLIYQPLIWKVGRATARRLPRLRESVLHFMERRGLLAHPLAAPETFREVVTAPESTADVGEVLSPVAHAPLPYPPDVQRLHALFVEAQAQQEAQR